MRPIAVSFAGLRPGGEIGEGISHVAADRGRIVGRQHPAAMRLERGVGCTRGLGRGVERPAEMLARMAAADVAAAV